MNKYRLTERLKEFINERHQAEKGKITQKQLEDYFKDTPQQRKRQTFSNYLNGRVAMPSDLLYEVAKKLNISADYLLGLSDIKTTNEDIKAAAALTGLSSDAIEALSTLKDISNNPKCYGAGLDALKMIDIFLSDLNSRLKEKDCLLSKATVNSVFQSMWDYYNANSYDVSCSINGNSYTILPVDCNNKTIDYVNIREMYLKIKLDDIKNDLDMLAMRNTNHPQHNEYMGIIEKFNLEAE